MNKKVNKDGKLNPNWKGGLKKLTCPICGVTFEVKLYVLNVIN
jgi:hypothetical protein